MRIQLLFIGLVFLFVSSNYAITTDGNAYLENQTDHSGIEVFLERIAPSSLIYTVYTILAFLFGGDPNVAYSAHLGGLAVGIIAGLREGGVKGLLIVSILFVVLFMTPVIWNILSALDYSRILGSLF